MNIILKNAPVKRPNGDGEIKKQKKRIPQITDRMKQIERVMNKLYEDNTLGNIEREHYEQLSEKYAEEYYSLKTEQEKIEERLFEFENANQRVKILSNWQKAAQILRNLLPLPSMSLSVK